MQTFEKNFTIDNKIFFTRVQLLFKKVFEKCFENYLS